MSNHENETETVAAVEDDHWMQEVRDEEFDRRYDEYWEDDAVSQGMYDDDPSPYDGTYSEM